MKIIQAANIIIDCIKSGLLLNKQANKQTFWRMMYSTQSSQCEIDWIGLD